MSLALRPLGIWIKARKDNWCEIIIDILVFFKAHLLRKMASPVIGLEDVQYCLVILMNAAKWSQPCGDPYDLPSPRPQEGGGTYGRGLIVRRFSVLVLMWQPRALITNICPFMKASVYFPLTKYKKVGTSLALQFERWSPDIFILSLSPFFNLHDMASPKKSTSNKRYRRRYQNWGS